MEDNILICIGDIHGYLDKIKSLWTNLELALGEDVLNDAIVVFLGDYCDKGPDTKGVLDWIIDIKEKRRPDSTICLAGNHDFGMAAYLGCIPADNIPEDFNLDTTRNPKFTKGYFKYDVGKQGMHYMGRRWGGSESYKPRTTFDSYDIDLQFTVESRQALKAAVPHKHKEFLQNMVWIYETNMNTLDPSRIICTHAGIGQYNVDKQIIAMKNRDIFDINHYSNEINNGRMYFLSGRNDVLHTPSEFNNNVLLISGHHGRRVIKPNRIIMDKGAGKVDNNIEAIILPSKVIISSQ